MISTFPLTINCRGRLIDLSEPKVMGILNITPDSFFEGSRTYSAEAVRERIQQMLVDGVDIIDIGAYSSRPGAADVSEEEECIRLKRGLQVVREIAPEIIVSVDTFRSDIARMAVEEYNVDIINDISGGEIDHRMFQTAAKLHTPYILMHMQGTPQTMQVAPSYDNLLRDIFTYFSERIDRLHQLGVNDVILDPGFGFGKTLEQNYDLMAHIADFEEFNLPLLVGISRKSMIFKLLNATPQTSLNGTTALHMFALTQGAHILRVHDVKAAKEVVTLYQQLNNPYSE